MKNRQNNHARRQRGVAAVEFALLLIPMLILGFGIVEYGRAVYQYNTVVKSVRSAVRVLSQHNPDDAGYAARITQAKCLAVYGNDSCSGKALAAGMTVSHIKVCDRNVSTACEDLTQADFKNVATGQGTINLVLVRVSGYQFSFIGLPFVSAGSSITFGSVEATMRQTG
jgi:Flp pilus assembly protein TadG